MKSAFTAKKTQSCLKLSGTLETHPELLRKVQVIVPILPVLQNGSCSSSILNYLSSKGAGQVVQVRQRAGHKHILKQVKLASGVVSFFCGALTLLGS